MKIDLDIVKKYAAENPSDPFASRRAFSRMKNFPSRDADGKAPVEKDMSGHLTTD